MYRSIDLSAVDLPCGLLIIDAKNNIKAVNAVLCDWLGFAEQELVESAITNLFPPASRMIYLGHVLPSLQINGRIDEHYLSFKIHSGQEIPILVNGKIISWAGQDYFSFALMRMHRRHLIEEQLLAEKKRAEQEKTEKDAIYAALQDTQAQLVAEHNQVIALNAELEQLTLIDSLTGQFNRRVYDKELDKQLHLFERKGLIFSLLLMDIDYFKKINDNFGHDTGDQVLKQFSAIVRENLRDSDILTRIGGEEFAVIMPATSLAEAGNAAERYRQQIAAATFVHGKVTASFGLSTVVHGDTKTTLYHRVDHALYSAKAKGRNQVVSAA